MQSLPVVAEKPSCYWSSAPFRLKQRFDKSHQKFLAVVLGCSNLTATFERADLQNVWQKMVKVGSYLAYANELMAQWLASYSEIWFDVVH